MNNFLVKFTEVNKSFIVENVNNEADAINVGFGRLEAAYPELFASREYHHVECTAAPIHKNETVTATKSTNVCGHCVK